MKAVDQNGFLKERVNKAMDNAELPSNAELYSNNF